MSNGQRSGQGTFFYEDGNIYRGSWKNDEKSGYGVEEGDNYYEGEWLHNLKNGRGSMKFSNGSKYEGEFHQNFPDGKGVFQNQTMKYEGEFKMGSFSGKGKLSLKNGDKF